MAPDGAPPTDAGLDAADEVGETLPDLGKDDLHDLVVVAKATTPGEATAMVAKLEDAGIPAVMEGQTFNFPGALGSPLGVTRIRVPRKLKRQAEAQLPELWQPTVERTVPGRAVVEALLGIKAWPALALPITYFGAWALGVGICLLLFWEVRPDRWRQQATIVSMLMLLGGGLTAVGAFTLNRRFRLWWIVGATMLTALLASLPFVTMNPCP